MHTIIKLQCCDLELCDGELLQVQAHGRYVLCGVHAQLSVSICVILTDLIWTERAKRIMSGGVVLISQLRNVIVRRLPT